MSLRNKLRADIQLERPQIGMIGRYLAWMRGENPRGAESLEADLIDIFSSEKGLRVLKLLEKSVLNAPMPDGSSDCALREFNAVRNHVLEIRRIVANGGD